MTLSARSKTKAWVFWVLVPTTVGLLWAGWHAWTIGPGDMHFQGRNARIVNSAAPEVVALFFLGIALICLAVIAFALIGRWRKTRVLEIDDTGITSRVLGGRGHLDWPQVTHLMRAEAWLYVFGQDAQGRRRKLAVSLWHLDKSEDEILAAVYAHRPDLFG